MRALRELAGVAESESVRGDGWRGEDVEWIRGKTVLMIGDSVVRNQVSLSSFCRFG